jgi:modulator of FtsH protease
MQPQSQVVIQPSQQAVTQNRVLRNTYWLLGLTLIPTVIGAALGINTNFSFLAQNPIMGPLLMFAVMMGVLFGISKVRNTVWAIPLLLGFTFIMGWWLGPMLQYALHFRNGAQLIGVAAGGTAAIFFTLAGIATVSKRDFSFLGNFLFIGLILVVIASLANLFLQIPALSLTVSGVAILLFSGFILFDVNRIVRGGETNYVMATLALYLDIYNLFVHLLNILLAFTGSRE